MGRKKINRMTKTRNKALFVLYAVLIGVILLYVLFPSDAVRNAIVNRIQRDVPDLRVSIGDLTPAFPLALLMEDVMFFKKETLLFSADRMTLTPRWISLFTPDKEIAFKSTENTNESGKEEIYVMDSDGSNARRLTNVTGWQSDHDPSWSSDSNLIYFERFEGVVPWTKMTDTYYFLLNWQTLVPWNVYSVDLEGNLEKITNCEYICWLPVQYGDRIMFLKDTFNFLNETLFSIRVDYVTIMHDGSEEAILLGDDGYAYKKAYFDF